MRHFLDMLEIQRGELETLLSATAALKAAPRPGALPLAGYCLGLVFEKPSLRTRVSFQAAMSQLGGASIFLSGADAGLGTREPISDYARVMTSYVDALVVRTFQHATVEAFARFAACPVINGLSDRFHPCQSLADAFTIHERFGKLQDKTLVFVGDGNNVARSLAIVCALSGMKFRLACPKNYEFDANFLEVYRSRFPGRAFETEYDPQQAVRDADVIYTDVWTSMGQEAEAKARKIAFETFQVNAALLAQAPAHAVVMHCLPAHRGEEIADDVLNTPRSIIYQQAANRLHAQKTLLLWLLRPEYLI